LKLSQSLIEQRGVAGPRDAADSLALHHRLDATNREIVLLAARAEARWAQRKAEQSRGNLSEEDRAELSRAVAAGKEWVRKAAELDAGKKDIRKAEAEIAGAEKLLERSQ
jgi:hypothetical protein